MRCLGQYVRVRLAFESGVLAPMWRFGLRVAPQLRTQCFDSYHVSTRTYCLDL